MNNQFNLFLLPNSPCSLYIIEFELDYCASRDISLNKSSSNRVWPFIQWEINIFQPWILSFKIKYLKFEILLEGNERRSIRVNHILISSFSYWPWIKSNLAVHAMVQRVGVECQKECFVPIFNLLKTIILRFSTRLVNKPAYHISGLSTQGEESVRGREEKKN